MKFPKTMMAVMGALALVAAGCKYDDAADADALNSRDRAGGAGIDTVECVTDESGMAATEVPFDKDPNYVRCTDVEFAPVYFGFDASNLSSAELAKIEAVAQHLKENSDRVVIVEGNCDDRGSNEYNMSLGENRAIIIRNYLVQNGIAADRIQTRSYGEERPAATGSGESVWSLNRRGEFAIYQK